MGACCCAGQSPRDHLSTSGTTTEPLLKESEREAVSAILRFIDSGENIKLCKFYASTCVYSKILFRMCTLSYRIKYLN